MKQCVFSFFMEKKNKSFFDEFYSETIKFSNVSNSLHEQKVNEKYGQSERNKS